MDYNIESSVKRNPPGDIQGSKKRNIQVELYTDLFSSERFVEVSLSAQIVLSGLQIDTKRSSALQEFSIQYARRGIQYPNEMETMMVSKHIRKPINCTWSFKLQKLNTIFRVQCPNYL